MPKELVISAAPHETRVAILEDGLLCEIYIEREKEFALVGSIYKGRVTRVLPGMQSAFVEIGLDSDAFLYVGDFLENLEDYDHVVTPVEEKVQKMEQQGGSVFARPAPAETPALESAQPGASPAQEFAPSLSEPSVPETGGLPEVESPRAPEFNVTQRQPFARPPAPYGQQGQGQQGHGQQGRGPNRFGQGQGRDRGGDRGGERGGDRGGRRGGGGGGGRWRGGRGNDRRPNRDLPPSKYASPRPFTPRPYEPPTEELPADFEPIILPGESLAKYKDRAPSAHPPTAAGTASDVTPASASASDTASPSDFATGLPPTLYASPTEAPKEAVAETPEPQWTSTSPLAPSPIEAPAELDSVEFEAEEVEEEVNGNIAEVAPRIEPIQAPAEVFEAQVFEAPAKHADLSDEEASSLAEQVAEARQDEARAKVDSAEHEHGILDEEDAHAPEGTAETEEFVAEAEAGESEDAAIIEATGEGMEDAVAEGGPEGGPAEPSDSVQPEARPMSARVSEPNRARFQRPMRRGGHRQHGNRPRHQDHRHQQQRRPQLISEVLKAGQEIIVQIAKEPLGKKGARITSHVALPGRFLVYMPTVNHIGVSRRIASAEERSRLRRLVTESKGTFPGGFIVRTAADGAPDDEIRADVEFLGRTWEKIRAQGEPRKAPALLHRDLNLVERILRDYVSNDYSSIWIDNEEEFGKVVEFVSRFQPKLVSRVKLYTKPAPIFEEFGIQQELDKALRPKVWLKSGGYIVINHTEALVAIDVNTGKYVGRGGTRLEDTIVKTNLEAVKEIVRQVRLRDLGGIIILDLIDMEERRNRDKVMAALDQELRADRAPSKVLSFNEFGLVSITRKRTKQALERVLCQPCPYCTGSGMVKSVPTICYEIQAEARKMAADLDSSSITLRVHPEIAKALKTREAALIEELEQATRKSAIIQADPTLHWEQYDIY